MKKISKKSKINIHFIGIGGIGMSGIAELMLDKGYSIQGSDISFNENVKRLKKKGVKIFLSHNKKNIRNISAAIFSSAIKKSNCEIQECKKLFIPLLSRADMLAELMRDKNSIAIAGSHGKTTTTSLVGTILENSNLDPTIINGGIINAYSKNNRLGYGKWMVVEADESDGSFLKLPHEINIITNIDSEHLDYFITNKYLIDSFKKFILNLPFYGFSILCIDDQNCRAISKKINTRKIITYSKKIKNANVRILEFCQKKYKTTFTIFIKKNIIPNYSGKYKFTINLLGEHNVSNATAAIISSLLIGVSISDLRKSLYKFTGVNRRFSFLGKINKALIYDDYAHHPTEIEASYSIAKYLKKNRIIVIFQPHRFTRTKQLYNKFIRVLNKIDILYICDIYSAGEKSIKNIHSQNLVNTLNKKKKQVFYLSKKENFNTILSKYYSEENIIIFMGAGSITNIAKDIIKQNNV